MIQYEVVYGSLGVVESGTVDEVEALPFHEVESETEFLSYRNSSPESLGIEFFVYREYEGLGKCSELLMLLTGEGYEPVRTTVRAMGIDPYPF